MLAVLTGCAPRQYEEIHGKVLERTAETNTDLISTGEILMPVQVTSYYLNVEYTGTVGETIPAKIEVDEVAHASCWKGLNFKRAEDGSVSCTVPGAEGISLS